MSAAATVGMTENELWETTPLYLSARLAAHRREIERQENWQQWNMELARHGYLYLLNIQLDKPDKMKPADFFPFPWDEKPEAKQPADHKAVADEHIRKMGYAEGIPADQFFK